MDDSFRIAYTRPDGGVSIIVPSPDFEGTVDDFIAAHDCLEGASYVVIQEDEQPLLVGNFAIRQRTFRNAWTIANGAVVTDMPSAKDIHLANIRRIRAEKLKELDNEFTVAERNGEDLTQLKALRAALLAATDEVKNGQHGTPEELYSAWPEVLEARK